MMRQPFSFPRLATLACACLSALGLPSLSRAQSDGVSLSPALPQTPTIFRDLSFLSLVPPTAPLSSSRLPRLGLLRTPAVYMNGPAGLDDTDPPDPDAPPTIPDFDDTDSRVLVAIGTDNPFFSMRDRGAPGGVGYYRLHSQLQLFDTGHTGCSLALNAVTPAGLEANGVADGPTYLSPALTLFHDLGDGTGLHCFVGQDVRANAAWRQTVGHSMQYSLAMQQAVPGLAPDPSRGVFLFVETAGSVGVRDPNAPATLEVVPGVHYRLSDNWWVSGGLALPVGTYQDGRRLQFTCSWKY